MCMSPKHKSTLEDCLQLPVTAHLRMERVRKSLLREWSALDQQIRDPCLILWFHNRRRCTWTIKNLNFTQVLRLSFAQFHNPFWDFIALTPTTHHVDHSHQSTSSAVFSYVEKLENHLVSSRRCALTLFGRINYSRYFPCRSERINKLALSNKSMHWIDIIGAEVDPAAWNGNA